MQLQLQPQETPSPASASAATKTKILLLLPTAMASPAEKIHSPADVKQPVPPPNDGEPPPQESKPMSRQSSVQSLNLDEFQPSALDSGKNLGSMNMDEFLLSIWSAEEARQAGAVPDPRVQSDPQTCELASVDQPRLCRHGPAAFPPENSEKEQQLHKVGNSHEVGGVGNAAGAGEELCEGMTLEDFLMKAGVVPEGFGASSPSGQGPNYYENSANGVAPAATHRRNSGGESEGLVAAGAAVTAAVSPQGVDEPASQPASGGGRKRMMESGGAADQGAERRQRRMIKNRESAARSRARRQAYTMELEAELNQLKEENAQIKKETEELIEELKQKLMEPPHNKDNEGPSAGGVESKKLRRTSSSPI